MAPDPDTDARSVVIVGAGLAGLVAARELRRAGIEVTVLESADRVGGRSMAVTSALGSRLDLGGQWIGHDHDRLDELARELGLTIYPMHTSSMPVLLDGERRVAPWAPSTLLAVLLLLWIEVLTRLGLLQRLDSDSIGKWLARIPVRRTRRLLELVVLISWTCEPDRTPIGAMAVSLKDQGGLVEILSTKGGAQDSLIVEGAGTIAERIAEELGDRVRTGERVASIVRSDDGVAVRTASGEINADRVIVTAPPPVAATIEHEPPLPPERLHLQRSMYMGLVYKAIAVYDRPFWRDGIGVELMQLQRPGFASFDSGPPDGPGHLCILVGGPEAEELDALEPDRRRATLLGPLAAHLGPEILEPADWQEKSWHLDEHAGGGYCALPLIDPDPALLPVDPTPTGRVHWAGTETAGDHPGYLDGAIESGLRVAKEVEKALG